MKRAAALLLACLGASAVACDRSTIQSGDARLSFDRARVQIASAGSGFRTVEDGTTLHSGDRVRVVTGEAEMQLPRRARLILRKGSEIVVGREPTLNAGDAVAEVTDEPLTVRSAGSTATVRRGATRIRGGLALTAGVYEGSARVASAGSSLDVPAFRQASVASFGVVPARPSALEYSEEDKWDLHYLGVAIEIGRELQAKSEGFSSQLREGEGLTPGFYTNLLPDLPDSALTGCPTALDGSLGEGRRPGEVLVGTTLALQGRSGTFTTRCTEAFAFRDDGATWGLVALDQRVRSLPAIRDRLLAAFGRLPTDATIAALAPPAPERSTDVGPAVAVEPAAPSPTASPAPAPAPTPGPTPTPTIPNPAPDVPGLPPVTPLLPPLPDPTDGLLTPVTDLVDDLLGGLLGG
ncbi:MAG: putative surface-exposed virulence protein [Actinomycetota bacterium]|jgi:hypothetical protein